ncbi:hypothetical protein [Paenibacillus sp. Soil787]|uniref:hypothetical protein n=1 Tax=Paenibacillus sp. Soil787 TaxID=1736411 RepID=UPI000A49F17B|nr:hypothetical protein [Paenibacillus sp. Soil787]
MEKEIRIINVDDQEKSFLEKAQTLRQQAVEGLKQLDELEAEIAYLKRTKVGDK